jgi:ABC-type branched-subunit amino acid transport system permease subunit
LLACGSHRSGRDDGWWTQAATRQASVTSLLPVLFDGVVYASWLFLMAAGLTLIYRVMRILNIAHGSLYALGAYAAASQGRRRQDSPHCQHCP